MKFIVFVMPRNVSRARDNLLTLPDGSEEWYSFIYPTKGIEEDTFIDGVPLQEVRQILFADSDFNAKALAKAMATANPGHDVYIAITSCIFGTPKNPEIVEKELTDHGVLPKNA